MSFPLNHSDMLIPVLIAPITNWHKFSGQPNIFLDVFIPFLSVADVRNYNERYLNDFQ